MAEFSRITRQPLIGGKACLRDTGVTVSTVLALAAAGRSLEEITRIFPALTGDDVREALAYAAWLIDEKEVNLSSTRRPSSLLMMRPSAPETSPLAKSPNAASHPAEPKTDAAIETAGVPEFQETEDNLELFHPKCPGQPTVIVTQHSLFDRRWSTRPIEWSDIRELKYVSGETGIYVTLRNPQIYLPTMPFIQRQLVKLKLALRMHPFLLDTAPLGIRTKDLYHKINHLWLLHRGKLRFRKKRRIRAGAKTGRTAQDKLWNSLQPT